MGTTFQSFQDLVKIAIGGRDDSAAVTIIKEAINYGALMAALSFGPPELEKKGNVTVTGGSDYVSLNTLTDWYDPVKVYNQTDSFPMGFIPFELFDVIVPDSLVLTKYYSIYGTDIYVKKKPTSNKVLNVYYKAYPAKLASPSDQLEFLGHDPYIVSVASGITFAAFEETESAGIWQTVNQLISLPMMLSQQARSLISGRQVAFENVIKQLQEQT